MIEIKMSFECLEDAEKHISALNRAQDAETAVTGFYYVLRNKLKHSDLSETETRVLEDVRTDFCRIFEQFLN
jgi:hypothetical protein